MSRSSPPASRRGAIRLGPLLLALSGCATTAGSAGGKPQPAAPPVLVLRQADCCSPGAQASAAALIEALSRCAEVRQAETALSAAAPAAPTPDPAETLAQTLTHAQQAYLTMQMDQARKLLHAALERARQTAARGLRPSQLAQLHLLLVAVNDAQGRVDLIAHHSELALGFDPELSPNADIFPPPVREAIERARQELERVDVVIRTLPEGALVHWDGIVQGQAPVRLPQQPRGRHYLLVEHPLSLPRREVIHLSTAAEFKVVLEPAAPELVRATAAARPELRPLAAQLLGVKGIIWLADGAEEALAVECPGPDGAPRRLTLAAGAPSLLVQQAAETCLRQEALASANLGPTAAAGASASQPAGEAAISSPGHFRRYWWAWAAAGAVALSAGITLPLVLSGEEQTGRPVRLELPGP